MWIITLKKTFKAEFARIFQNCVQFPHSKTQLRNMVLWLHEPRRHLFPGPRNVKSHQFWKRSPGNSSQTQGEPDMFQAQYLVHLQILHSSIMQCLSCISWPWVASWLILKFLWRGRVTLYPSFTSSNLFLIYLQQIAWGAKNKTWMLHPH